MTAHETPLAVDPSDTHTDADLSEDITTTATLEPDTPVTSSFAPGGVDSDWFRATLTAGQRYSVELTGFNGSGELKSVFDAEGKLVYTLDDGGFGSAPFAVREDGTYYVAVSTYLLASDDEPPAPYALTLATLEPDAEGETPAGAAPAYVGGPATSGQIDHLGDVDVFAVSLDAGRVYTAEASYDDPVSGAPTFTEFSLRTAAGEFLRTGFLRDGVITTGAVTVPESGTYYLSFSDLSQGGAGAAFFTPYAIAVAEGPADALVGTAASERLDGTAADDVILAGGGDDTTRAGDGNDEISGGAGDDVLTGENGDDSLFGGAGDDVLAGADGNDLVDGGAGRDNLGGGFGDDTLNGGTGNDTLGGGRGDDDLRGGTGDDVMSAGAGRDTIDGGDGGDTIGAGFGDDLVAGGDGADSLGGGNGRDSVFGGGGDDSIGGGLGHDTVHGDDGDDFLAGGGGLDELVGGAGDDTLNGGSGNDVLYGSGGADVFVFNDFRAGEIDVLGDFEDGTDLIRVRLGALLEEGQRPRDIGSGPEDYMAAFEITDGPSGAEIVVRDHAIRVSGVNAADLTADDFLFV